MSIEPPKTYPWSTPDPDPFTVYVIQIDQLVIPEIRSTSVFSPDEMAELEASIKTEGQKDPVKCRLVDGKIVLADGFNRIMALVNLGVAVVKALVTPGTIADVQLDNILTIRARGKENPAETAEVIRELIDVQGMTKKEVQIRLGMSDSWMRRLYVIAKFPPEVKDHIKYGRLSASTAYHLHAIEADAEILKLANFAVLYGYSEEQMKAAVNQVINPDYDQTNQPYIIQPNGEPQVVLPKCSGCNIELKTHVVPASYCPSCYDTAMAFFNTYFAAPTTTPAPTGEQG